MTYDGDVAPRLVSAATDDRGGDPVRVSVFPTDRDHGPVWLDGSSPFVELRYSPALEAALGAWQQEWDARSANWPDVERWISDGQQLVLRLQTELGPNFSVSLGVGPDEVCRADLLVRSPADRASESPPLEELTQQGWSADYIGHAGAGVRLVGYADSPASGRLLLQLLLDAGDTFVTQEVSEALLARGDSAALRLYAKGWHLADDHQAEHLASPIWLVRSRRALWEELTADEDNDVASGAREVLSWADVQSERSLRPAHRRR